MKTELRLYRNVKNSTEGCDWLLKLFLLICLISCLDIISFLWYKVNGNIRKRASFRWSADLDLPAFLDSEANYTTNYRHGTPLKLYYKTGSFLSLSDLRYTFPLRKHSGLSVDCSSVLQVGRDEKYRPLKTFKAIDFMHNKEVELDTGLSNCEHFINDMGYVMDPLTNMEKEFPIAYSILVYKHFVQFEMLLRTIYRPQNIYCVHVDLKADQVLHLKIKRIANCFDNVFITHRSVNVTWGKYSVLEPEIICLEELWSKSVRWKYWINLAGQEFPLRTNYELVKILKAFNGANNVEAQRKFNVWTRLKKAGSPPHQLKPVKGAVHVILARDFVDYVLHNRTARDLLNWSRDVEHPDEIFFNTLNYNPKLRAPASYKGKAKTTAENAFLARLDNRRREWFCYGKQVRGLCIFNLGDLPFLATREEMFVNKFHFDYSPESLYCMEELIYNRTLEEYRGFLDFNVSYYASRQFVRNRF